ncbi:50S ribosomal protein L25 [Candidatus Daviesbacteria bacterium]|nr:50S ribosomal protein L25 [Candidatus Daviesbacteria bacterium]
MDRLSLQAEERKITGKKVKHLRKDGKLPAHVFGKGLETEVVSVDGNAFLKTFKEAGETGLIDLKISKLAADAVGSKKVRPVMIRGVQFDPVSGDALHIDFYQVNLSEKVKVPVPLVLIGEEPESVKLGETVVLQQMSEIEVEALPADLIEKIEVDITNLKNIDDAVTVGQLNFDRSKLTVATELEAIVVKLAPAITEEMKKQMEEEAAAAAAAVLPAEGAEGAPAEGEVSAEGHGPEESKGEAPKEGEQAAEGEQKSTEEAPKE